MELDDHGALVLAPMRSLLTSPPEGGPAYPPSNILVQNDSLVLYFEPDRLYVYPASETAAYRQPPHSDRRPPPCSPASGCVSWRFIRSPCSRNSAPPPKGCWPTCPRMSPPSNGTKYPLLRRIELRTNPHLPRLVHAPQGRTTHPVADRPRTGHADALPPPASCAPPCMKAALFNSSTNQLMPRSPGNHGTRSTPPSAGPANFYTIRSSDKHHHAADGPAPTGAPRHPRHRRPHRRLARYHHHAQHDRRRHGP